MGTDEPKQRGTRAFDGVLFDLDGTLLDTAPDMGGALNALRVEQGRPELPLESIRDHVSHGSVALIRLGFDKEPLDEHFEVLQRRFLRIYRARIARETRPFPGIQDLLAILEEQAIPWGVVTNKPAWLTEPLLDELGLLPRAQVVISGDTSVNRKPHPEPLLMASRSIGVRNDRCLYVGDAERDIEAGNRAGMYTVAALFGYIGANDNVHSWGADSAVESAAALLPIILGATFDGCTP